MPIIPALGRSALFGTLLLAAGCVRAVDAPPSSVILFSDQSVALDAGAQGVIDEFARDAQSAPRRQVLVEGYSDSAGAVANQQLALRRTQAVADALVQRGIDRTRISLLPRPPGNSEPGLESRRVELELGR